MSFQQNFTCCTPKYDYIPPSCSRQTAIWCWVKRFPRKSYSGISQNFIDTQEIYQSGWVPMALNWSWGKWGKWGKFARVDVSNYATRWGHVVPSRTTVITLQEWILPWVISNETRRNNLCGNRFYIKIIHTYCGTSRHVPLAIEKNPYAPLAKQSQAREGFQQVPRALGPSGG